MTVSLVGSGAAIDAVEAALADVGVERTTGLDSFADAALGVVVGDAGGDIFERASERARASGVPWFAIERGGMGGLAVTDAAVAMLSPEGACYDCLRARVRANADGDVPEGNSAGPDSTAGTRTPAPETVRFAGAIAGREAVRAVTADADVFGRVVEPPFTERPLLPVPNCGCAPAGDPDLRRNHVDRSLEDAVARAERALDERVGIVQEVGEAESFPAPYYLARSCDTSGFSDASAPRDAAGVDADWNRAFMKGLGEALERYCGGVYRTDAMESATPDNLARAVAPSAFVCETAPDGEEIRWVEGEALETGERAFLPAEFVHYPPPTQRYRSAVTTGLGLGNDGVEALCSGLYEVVERDAAMLAWHSTFDPLGLDVADEDFETLERRAAAEGLSVTPVLLTMDVDVPVVAVALQREEWPRFAVGTDADLSVARAARSALAEALQNWMELRGMGPDGAAEALGAIGEYAETPGPAADFADPGTVVPATDVGPDAVPAGRAELDALLERLAEANLAAYAARITTRDVDHLGFEAVRAVVPAAQPLCFGDPYFGERAVEVPDALGFEARPGRAHHPFP